MELFSFARTGNTFILLAPFNESRELQEHRETLQSLFGGRAITPVHFTCQRFMFSEPKRMESFLADLKAGLQDFQPIPINAYSIVNLYSEFRRGRVLKWRIRPPEALQSFSSIVEQQLISSGGKSLYPPGWMSMLISGVENTRRLDMGASLQAIPIPQPLFVGEQVLLSQYTEEGTYKILDQFPLAQTLTQNTGSK